MKINFNPEVKEFLKSKGKNKTSLPFTKKQEKEFAKGWYIHCEIFYVGFGWTTLPPCPKCDKRSKRATKGEVYRRYSGQ